MASEAIVVAFGPDDQAGGKMQMLKRALVEGEPSGKRKAEEEDKASKKHRKYVVSDEEDEDEEA